MPYTNKEIAIIGISGKFASLENINAYWDALLKGDTVVNAIKNDRLKRFEYDSQLNNKDQFDPAFFGYSMAEARIMDPQIRIFHEYVWHAIEDANIVPVVMDKIGVFSSASENLLWKIHVHNSAYDSDSMSKSILSNEKFISSLVSYKLNFRGPSMFIDTACSSSLVAVHQACRSLLTKECNIAIAGGISATNNKLFSDFDAIGSIYSQDGKCRAFDALASGTIPGEGVGVIVLKRLKDAISDNNHIYAIIKGSAINNDGKDKIGFTAPSVGQQVNCIESAIAFSQVPKESIKFIEAHGTGTSLGDSVEFETLKKVFKSDHSCYLGAVKTSIGHTDVASGIAGLIKATLTIHHKKIPPTLNFCTPHPSLRMNETGFVINRSSQEWLNNGDYPLRAGVSSFGIGGTNAHVVLEQHIVEEIPCNNPHSSNIFLFSAKSQSSLNSRVSEVKEFELKNTVNAANLSYSLALGRDYFPYRHIAVGQSLRDAAFELNNLDQKITSDEVVFLFTGQGEEYLASVVNSCYENNSFFKQDIDNGLDILRRYTKIKNIVDLFFANRKFVTEHSALRQPFSFIIQYSIARSLMKSGVVPSRMFGHSFGEYVAATISGVFSYEDALRIIVRRGDLVSKIGKGSMLEINLSINNLTSIDLENIDLAAINGVDLLVVSGQVSDIEKLKVEMSEKKIVTLKVKSEYAFHSRMMDGILDDFKKFIGCIERRAPNIPYVSSLTGEFATEDNVLSDQYWIDQMRQPVQFVRGLELLKNFSRSCFLEIGPRSTLAKLVRRHYQSINANYPVFSVFDYPEQILKVEDPFLNFLGKLWVHGVNVSWREFFVDRSNRFLPHPTYSFDNKNFQSNIDMNALKKCQEIYEKLFVKIDPAKVDIDIDDNILRSDMGYEYVEPKSKFEKLLVEIWKEIFGYDKISVDDDFFVLGGDSIKALKLLNRVDDVTNVRLKVEAIYKNPTIKLIAKKLDFIEKEYLSRNKRVI